MLKTSSHYSVVLPYGESVPIGVEASFLQQASAMAAIWRPNQRMQDQIERLAAKLGLDEHDVTKRRPVIAYACVRALAVMSADERLQCADTSR